LEQVVEKALTEDSTIEITFSYHGYPVTVTGDGVVHLGKEDGSER
jgi:hypothetical protein